MDLFRRAVALQDIYMKRSTENPSTVKRIDNSNDIRTCIHQHEYHTCQQDQFHLDTVLYQTTAKLYALSTAYNILSCITELYSRHNIDDIER